MSPKYPSSARIERIIDSAAGPRICPFWKYSDNDLAAAINRACGDARSFERGARQRRRAMRFLSKLVQRRTELAARRAAQQAELVARHKRLAAIVDAPLQAAE